MHSEFKFPNINQIAKIKNLETLNTHDIKIQHTLKFATLYTPSTIKDISLFYRKNLEYNSRFINKPNKKILIKQSYILMMWLNYIMDKVNKKDSGIHLKTQDQNSQFNSENIDINNTADVNADETDSNLNNVNIKKPSFFIYPFRNYKTTIVKAPMAHRSYSQEQFMIRFYMLSITFYTKLSIEKNGLNNFNINKSFYFANILKVNTPYTGTNMLFLQKYCIFFDSMDINFFSFYRYTNLSTRKNNKQI